MGNALSSGLTGAQNATEQEKQLLNESSETLDELYLSDTVLDILHPERTAEAVFNQVTEEQAYNNYLAQ